LPVMSTLPIQWLTKCLSGSITLYQKGLLTILSETTKKLARSNTN
jgi:hypothetical protein